MITDIWEFIKELWKDQPLWTNLASLAAVTAALYGFLHFVGKGMKPVTVRRKVEVAAKSN